MKKFVKILSLLLALIMTLSVLASCGGEEEEETKKKKKKKKDPVESSETVGLEISETTDPDHEHEWDYWELIREPTCQEEGINSRTCISCGATEEEKIPENTHSFDYTDGVIVETATPEKDGLRVYRCIECGEKIEKVIERSDKWVYNVDSLGYCSGSYTINGVYRDCILDASGSTVYVSESGEEIEMYANGLFISKMGGVYYLKKVDGTVVCSSESLGISGFGLISNYVDYGRFFEDGYIFAYDDSGSKMKIGILGTDGKWIAPISADNPITNSGTYYTVKQFNSHYYNYLGCGVLALPSSEAEHDYELYNIDDNALYQLDPDASAPDLDYVIREKSSFVDGVSVGFVKSVLYKVNVKGEVEVIRFDGSAKSDALVTANGDCYFFTETALLKNGTVYKELDYKIVGGTWIGEKCLVLMKDSSDKGCFTYVTKDGKFLFDPVKTDAVYACDVSGTAAGSNIANGDKIVVDDEGEIYYTTENAGAYLYVNNGVAREEVRGTFSSNDTFTRIG